MKANVQLEEKAMEEQSLLASGENSSAFKVQASGPNPSMMHLHVVKEKLQIFIMLKSK